MENSENKYKRGKIYKIISNQTNDVYYGSTVEPYLTNRLSVHRCHYKTWLNGKYNYTTSFEIVKFEDAKIILIENYPCDTKYELLAREQFYIENNVCVNKHQSLRTESRSVYDKEYYENNKEKISEYKTQYYENNKEKLLQRQKKCQEKNKLKLNEKLNCICGGKYTLTHKAKHEKTIKHQQFIYTQSIK